MIDLIDERSIKDCSNYEYMRDFSSLLFVTFKVYDRASTHTLDAFCYEGDPLTSMT